VTHQRYAWRLHRREQWTGHLWQQRFYSCPLDETYLLRAVRYVLLNPVRAGLVERAEDWPLSSLRSHLGAGRDELVDPEPLDHRIEDWTALLREPPSAAELESIRRRTRYGRALPEADEDDE
jgi:putative transposase